MAAAMGIDVEKNTDAGYQASGALVPPDCIVRVFSFLALRCIEPMHAYAHAADALLDLFAKTSAQENE